MGVIATYTGGGEEIKGSLRSTLATKGIVENKSWRRKKESWRRKKESWWRKNSKNRRRKSCRRGQEYGSYSTYRRWCQLFHRIAMQMGHRQKPRLRPTSTNGRIFELCRYSTSWRRCSKHKERSLRIGCSPCRHYWDWKRDLLRSKRYYQRHEKWCDWELEEQWIKDAHLRLLRRAWRDDRHDAGPQQWRLQEGQTKPSPRTISPWETTSQPRKGIRGLCPLNIWLLQGAADGVNARCTAKWRERRHRYGRWWLPQLHLVVRLPRWQRCRCDIDNRDRVLRRTQKQGEKKRWQRGPSKGHDNFTDRTRRWVHPAGSPSNQAPAQGLGGIRMKNDIEKPTKRWKH